MRRGYLRLSPSGVGLGLRWAFLDDVLAGPIDPALAFFEVSPENYMRRGGRLPAALHRVAESRPLLTHGLMLGVGGPPPDPDYLTGLRGFLDELGADHHSDHLCWVGGPGACLHELLPLPFRSATARQVADNLRRAQDALGRPIALENISDYAALSRDPRRGAAELEFVCEVLERADCGLLLDLNNVAVNAHNHGHDAAAFVAGLPLARVVQIHVAGGEPRPRLDLMIDTHGAPVSPQVIDLLAWTLRRTGPLPVLYERDHNIPPYPALIAEVRELDAVYRAAIDEWTRDLADAPEATRRAASTDLSLETDDLPLIATRGDARRTEEGPTSDLSPETASFDLSLGTCGAPDPVLSAVQAAIADHITALAPRDPSSSDVEANALLHGAPKLGVYRELVRDALTAAVLQFLPRTRARRGEAFTADIAAWLAAGGPRSRLLRDVPGEFHEFITPRWNAEGPPWLADLARHELLEYRVAAAPQRDPGPARPFALDARLAFDASATLVEYGHAVHLLPDDEDDRSEPAPTRSVLLAYRDAGHAVRYLQLTPLAEAVVSALLAGADVQTAVHAGAAAERSDLNDDHLARIGALLADLGERGVILGGV